MYTTADAHQRRDDVLKLQFNSHPYLSPQSASRLLFFWGKLLPAQRECEASFSPVVLRDEISNAPQVK